MRSYQSSVESEHYLYDCHQTARVPYVLLGCTSTHLLLQQPALLRVPPMLKCHTFSTFYSSETRMVQPHNVFRETGRRREVLVFFAPSSACRKVFFGYFCFRLRLVPPTTALQNFGGQRHVKQNKLTPCSYIPSLVSPN